MIIGVRDQLLELCCARNKFSGGGRMFICFVSAMCTNFVDFRLEELDVVLYSIGVGVGGMEIIDKFACCRKISRVEKIRVRDETLSRVIFGAIWA